ncbi:MAG: HD domain-containing phosphohydrolase [Pseudomonadota bacterium]
MATDIQALDLRRVLDASPSLIFLHDREFRLVLANRAYLERAGVTEAEALGRPYWEVFPKGEGPLASCLHALENAEEEDEKEEVHLPGGEVFLSRSAAVLDSAGRYLYSRHDLSDITDLDRTRVALAESGTALQTIFDHAADGFLVARASDRRFVLGNRRMVEMLGYGPEEFPGLGVMDIHPEAELPHVIEQFERQRRGEVGVVTLPVKRKDGSIFPADISAAPLLLNGGECMMGIFRDVTEQHQARRRIECLGRMYRTISLCNQALVRATDELELCRETCRVLVDEGGFRSACVMYGAGPAQAQAVAWAGLSEEEARLVATYGAARAEEIGRALDGEAQADTNNDLAQTPVLAEGAARLGVAADAVLPLAVNGKRLGVLWVGSGKAGVFDEELVMLLKELAGDLSFGIANLRTRAERLIVQEKLDASLDHTVAAIASLVELRDPYTAGHQRRVADLACAIARDMGLDEDRILGLHMAGVVHDIGKIHVPAEILTSPGKLTDAEFEIIKTHPKGGYEILKGIDFPWPVADIVLQHHEKLDGSGYPQGLKGEEILLEARILCVADVVEAMSSHRPYRPGFGVFPALQEISRNKGRLYDAAAVEACLRLFLEKNYSLEANRTLPA